MMVLRQGHKTTFNHIVVALLCALTVSGLSSLMEGLFFDWENKTLDYRFRVRGPIPVDPRIVLIDIDDESIRKIGRWPWRRDAHAEMIHILSKSGAAVIGYDILFNQATGEKEDEDLETAIKSSGKVYLPTGFELEADLEKSALMTVKREIGPFPDLRQAAAGIGHISSNRDPDGTIRRVPLLVTNGEKQFLSFSLAILKEFLQISQEQLVLHLGEEIVLKGLSLSEEVAEENFVIPVDKQGMMVLNYAGRWVDTFTHYGFVDILNAWKDEAERENLKKALEGKIVIVSNSATGFDLKPIPFEADYPGGGVHANAINTILTGNYLQETSVLQRFGIVLLLSIITVLLLLSMRGWIALLSNLCVTFVYLWLTNVLFSKGLVLPVLSPLFTMTLASLTMLVYRNRLDQVQVMELTGEKGEMNASLRKITEKLRENEGQLDRTRHELSSFRENEAEKFLQIQRLEADMKRLNIDQNALIKEKKGLEDALSDATPSRIDEIHSPGDLELESSRYGIVTRDPEMLKLFERAKKFSKTEKPVLILGETGTGKELFAKAVHKMSHRSKEAFIPVNIPILEEHRIESELFGHVKGAFTDAHSNKKGLFHEADGGTIFLDEIGEMQPQLQAKLLRVIQEGEVKRMGATTTDRVNVRIIAATNRHLQDEVRKKTFREDLYYRLKVLTLTTIPLRARPEDIEALAGYFLKKNAKESGKRVKQISKKAMAKLKGYRWPGNVRELENAIDSGTALAEGDQITEENLGLEPDFGTPRNENRFDVNKGAVEVETPLLSDTDLSDTDFLKRLRNNRFKISKTAEQLNINYLAVGSRLKGICLKALAEHGRDSTKAAASLSEVQGEIAEMEKKIRVYHQNLIKSVEGFQESNEAIDKCHLLFRNVKKKYHPSMQHLVELYFEGRVEARN